MKQVPKIALFIAVVLAPSLTDAVQEITPTYIALKTTTRERLDSGAIFKLTLESGAWVRLRATDIDWERTAAYNNVVVVRAETVSERIDPATQSKYLNLTFPGRFFATVWKVDVDYDVMRSGFAAYHSARDGAAGIGSADAALSAKCEKDWPSDFRMRAYCLKTQQEAADQLRRRNMTTADERTIRQKCETDWPDDFKMRNYCEEQQLKALASIK